MELKGFGGTPMGDDDPPPAECTCECWCSCICWFCYTDVMNAEDDASFSEQDLDRGTYGNNNP